MTRIVALMLFIIFFIAALLLSPQVGPSWDEPDNIYAAGQYRTFFSEGMNRKVFETRDTSAFHDRIFSQEQSLHRYPPVPLYIGIVVTWVAERLGMQLTAPVIISLFHVASGIFWAILVVGLFLFGRILGISIGVSCITALIGGLQPTIVGYGISTIKDSAQVTLFVVSLLLFVSSTVLGKRRYFILGSIVWGLALATKINAVYVPIIWGGWRVVYRMRYIVYGRSKTAVVVGKEVVEFASECLGIFIIGMGVMVLVWPYLWFDPFSRIAAAFEYFTTVGVGYRVFWMGIQYMVGSGLSLPWYPLVHMAIATPIPILVLIALGLVSALWKILKKKGTQHGLELLLIFWIVFPLIRTFSPTAAFYDGARHFLEVMPAFCLIAGFGLHTLQRLIIHRGWSANVFYVFGFGILTHLVLVVLIFFPYTTGYVNALIANPNENLDRDFGALSIWEGIEIAHKAHPGFGAVFVPIGGHLSWYYLHPGDSYVYRVEDADIIILINKASHTSKAAVDTQISSMFRLVGTVGRASAEFAWVYVRK